MTAHDTRRNLVAFRRAVDSLGVTMPGPIAEILDAEPPMPPALPEVRAAAALAIAEAASLPSKEAQKKVSAALDDVARAEALAPIRDRVREILDLNRWDAVTAAEPEIRAAFRDAIAGDLETLNKYAPLVGDLNTAQPGGLSPERYEAVFHTKRAAERVDTAVAGLMAGRASGVAPLAPADARRLRALVLPDDLDRRSLRRLAYALTGSIPFGGNSLGSRPVAWYGVAASFGATFDLVDPATYRSNAGRVAEALRKTDEERARLDSPLVL